PGRPSDRTEETDRIVLGAVALHVVSDQLFVSALGNVSPPRTARKHRRDRPLEHRAILPSERLAEAGVGSHLADRRCNPSVRSCECAIELDACCSGALLGLLE